MKDETKITFLAISGILILEILAILKGIDGAYFGIVIAVISGLAGYELRNIKANLTKK